jgi:hypothetical protein
MLDLVNIHSDYLNDCFRNLDAKVKETVKKLKPHADRFEAIAVRGVSGLLVGPMVASKLGKPWCVIRKPGEGSHSGHKSVEGWLNFKTYLIIDDLIASGGTLKLIQQTLLDHARAYPHKWENSPPECVGYYLYNCTELQWRGDGKDFSYHDKYFLFPEAPKRPVISDQITEAAAKGQSGLALYNQICGAA